MVAWLFVVISLLLRLSSTTNGRICPFPKCETCPDSEQLRAPGIGFALETSHGAAVARLHNGTFHNIALTEGDASYTALMRRLATEPMNRVPDHYNTPWEKLQYVKSRTQRLLNKLVGRPATPETAVLASMVVILLQSTQSWLGSQQRLTAAALVSPDRIRLTDEEIGDVFDYLRVRNLLEGPPPRQQLFAMSAVYAAYGNGLCRTYTDTYECEAEEDELPSKLVLHLDFSRENLSGSLELLKNARTGSRPDVMFVDPDLGLGAERAQLLSATEHDDAFNQYWTFITNRIRELAQTYAAHIHMPRVTKLLLTGPLAANRHFQDAVRAALHDLVEHEDVLSVGELEGDENNDENSHSFFSFATARGAAEFAKRAQEGPTYCKQSDKCKRKRERVHGEQNSVLLVQQPSEL